MDSKEVDKSKKFTQPMTKGRQLKLTPHIIPVCVAFALLSG